MKYAAFLMMIGIVFAGVYDFPKESKTYVDSVGGTDTLNFDFRIATRDLTGDFTFQYVVRKVAGDTAVKIYYLQSNDTTFGWFKNVKIDSCTANDSDLVDLSTTIYAVNWLRIRFMGFGTTADTSLIKFILKGALSK